MPTTEKPTVTPEAAEECRAAPRVLSPIGGPFQKLALCNFPSQRHLPPILGTGVRIGRVQPVQEAPSVLVEVALIGHVGGVATAELEYVANEDRVVAAATASFLDQAPLADAEPLALALGIVEPGAEAGGKRAVIARA